MSTQRRIDPRVRAYGKARIDITRRAKDEMDWQRSWKEPRYPFPFSFGNSWKQCVEYRVDDFAAEVGFWMDVLGFPALAFSPSFAMFSSPDRDFTFSVAATPEGFFSTPPDAVRLQFFVENIQAVAEELERRGVKFEKRPDVADAGSEVISGYFNTPHGICIDLLGSPGSVSESVAVEDQQVRPKGIQIPLPPADGDETQGDDQAGLEPAPEKIDLYPAEDAAELPVLTAFESAGQQVSGPNPLDFGGDGGELEDADSRNTSADLENPFSPTNPEPVEPGVRGSRRKPSSSPSGSPPGAKSSASSRPDPFRLNGQGGFPSGSRRARSSVHPHPTRSNGGLSRPDSARGAANGVLGNGKQIDEPAPKDAQGEGYDDLRFETPKQPEPQKPAEPPDQELKYEDIEENEDYDAPY